MAYSELRRSRSINAIVAVNSPGNEVFDGDYIKRSNLSSAETLLQSSKEEGIEDVYAKNWKNAHIISAYKSLLGSMANNIMNKNAQRRMVNGRKDAPAGDIALQMFNAANGHTN